MQPIQSGTAGPACSAASPEARHAAVCAGAVKCLPDLRAYARALTGNGHQADDLVQTAILRALGAAQQFTPGTNFKAWSFTILRNAFYNQWRSRASQQVPLDDDVAAPATVPVQEASLELCDFRRAFSQLAPNHREALLLIGAAGLSYAEAGVVCSCASGTMKSRVSRGRAALRALMDGGALNLHRRDVMPISAVDLALALETAVAAASLPKIRRLRVQATHSGGDTPVARHVPADLDPPAMLLRS